MAEYFTPSSLEESRHGTTGGSSESETRPQQVKKKKYFHRELRYMMHGFGDDLNPYNETVQMIDDLVVEFILEMTQKATEIGKRGKVHVEDILHLTRRDPKKHARVKELLQMNEELKQAKKFFENTQEDI